MATLEVNERGKIFPECQFTGCSLRGDALTKYNVIEFFVNSDRRPRRHSDQAVESDVYGPVTNAYHITQNIQCTRRGCGCCAPPTTTRFSISPGKKVVGLWRTR